MLRLLFRITFGLIALGVMALLGGTVGIVLLALLPVAVIVGGAALAVFALICVLAMLL